MIILDEKLIKFGHSSMQGDTAEMLSITNVLQKDKYSLRFYIAAATNYMSLQKAQVLEESLLQQGEVHTVSPSYSN